MRLPSVLSPDSPQAQEVLDLFWVVLAVAAFIALLVATLVFIDVIRFRRRRADEPFPKQVEGSKPMEVFWTIGPLAIVTVLFFLTVRAMHEIQPPIGHRQPDLEVVAHQWWWEGHYLKTGVTVANEFHFPVGETLLLRFRSADVIHDWWVPQLGRKIDIFPNHVTHLWMRIERPGTYLGTCDEFCGPEHAWMRIRTVAETPAAYAAWTKQQLASPLAPESPTAQKGLAIFLGRPCASCHTIAGQSAGNIGPNLSHVGSRQTLGAGILQNDTDELTRWVLDAQAVKPGCHMPNLQLSKSEAQAVAVYLKELR